MARSLPLPLCFCSFNTRSCRVEFNDDAFGEADEVDEEELTDGEWKDDDEDVDWKDGSPVLDTDGYHGFPCPSCGSKIPISENFGDHMSRCENMSR